MEQRLLYLLTSTEVFKASEAAHQYRRHVRGSLYPVYPCQSRTSPLDLLLGSRQAQVLSERRVGGSCAERPRGRLPWSWLQVRTRKHSLRPADDRMSSGTEWPFGYHEPAARCRPESWDCSIQLVVPYYQNIQRGVQSMSSVFISASGAISMAVHMQHHPYHGLPSRASVF